MAGLFALSVNRKSTKDFLSALYWGTFYGQHLGEEWGGLSSLSKSQKITVRTHRGLFGPFFAENLQGMEGTEAVGFCGLACEPYLADTKFGKISVCFSGNIINSSKLTSFFRGKGDVLQRGDDVELATKLIVQGHSVVDGIRNLDRYIKGAYTLLALTKGGIYAARCPSGRWPLVLGKKEGAIAVASESSGFSNLGFELIRDLEPGEIVLLKNGQYETKDKAPGERIKICSFCWVYTGFTNAVFEGISASSVRERLGASLACRDIAKNFFPDIVLPVPDSGRFHALGYYQEFCRQVKIGKISPDKLPFFYELLSKYPYIGRSFMRSASGMRKLVARMKLTPSAEQWNGRTAVVNDDSVVRGVQTQENLVPKLKRTGLEEIHFRISYPELLSHCPWGKTTKRGELFARRLPDVGERAKSLGVASLEYNKINDLVEAIGLPRETLCFDCCLIV